MEACTFAAVMRTTNEYHSVEVTLERTVYRSVLKEALSKTFIQYPVFKMVMDSRVLNRMFCKKGCAASIDCKGRTIVFRVCTDLSGRLEAMDFVSSLAEEYGRLCF